MLTINDAYNEIIKGKKEIILFGAGKICEDFFAQLNGTVAAYSVKELGKIVKQIKYVVDNNENRWGDFVKGKEVVPIKKILEIKNKVIIITCRNISEITEQLINIGVEFSCIYNHLEWIYFMEQVRACEEANYLNQNSKQTDKVEAILFDEESKHIYRQIIDKRKTINADYRDVQEKLCSTYFQKNIIRLMQDEVFVDAGVFCGENSFQFAERTSYDFKKIYAFEPSEINMNIARESFSKHEEFQGRIKFIKKSLSNYKGKVKFIENKESAAVTDEGDIEVETTTLDSEIHEEVTFIKMDIEGSELAALKGSENIIKKYKPKLAICIYHRAEDLVTIPLYIKEIVPEYKLYVRHYTSGIADTVLYAVAE